MFAQLAIKAAAPIPKLDKYQRYLFIAPHPDDIEVAVGSTVAKLAAEGKEVYFLICTDGRFGTEDVNANPLDIVKIRQTEQLASAKVLGVTDVIFLPFSDGGLYAEEELRVEIAKVIAHIKPDAVVAPDYQLYTECHPDHVKVGEAAAHAYIYCSFYHIMKSLGCDEIAKPQVLAFYYTAKPNYYVKTGKHYKTFLKAINCFKSQFPIEHDDGSFKGLMLYINIRTRLFGIRKFSTHADAFRCMHNLHTHCCPEAEK